MLADREIRGQYDRGRRAGHSCLLADWRRPREAPPSRCPFNDRRDHDASPGRGARVGRVDRVDRIDRIDRVDRIDRIDRIDRKRRAAV